ncbi:MAG: flagellar biosynthetic protein FliR [Bryobacterales bacterium]|nr:flagellar biosynthetic protein FliR [Bryobacterales bacterium]
MPGDAALTSLLWSFVLVLARVSGVVALVPVPGWRKGPDVARIVFSLALTAALFPVWPAPPKVSPGIGELAGWILAECFFGLLLGIGVGFVMEGFTLAMQILGLQAGYAYASTIDPSSDADSSVLQVIAQLGTSLLFFSFRLDAELLRSLAASFEKHPAGVWMGGWDQAGSLLALGADMWKTAFRLALPVLALLVMLDVCLALLGRVQAQLQLLTLAFPAKMLVTLVTLAALAGVLPAVFRQQAEGVVFLWAK